MTGNAGQGGALQAELDRGVAALGLSLTPAQRVQLLDYQALIAKWNKVYNLTALRQPDDMLRQHLLDSLAALPGLRRHQQLWLGQHADTPERSLRLLDVGSGAGLPGVVFAICCPELQVCCVDTVAKKAAFIQQVAVALGLQNLKALHARVENLQQHDFDVICSRAFASLRDFTTWSAAALAEDGVWMAMKGKHPADELAEVTDTAELFHVEQLQVPGLQAERCVLWLRPR